MNPFTTSTMGFHDPTVVNLSKQESTISTRWSSMIFNALPKIPEISSVRRTIADFRDPANPGKGIFKDDTSDLEIAPPGYSTRPGSAGSSVTRHSIDSNDAELPFEDCISPRPNPSLATPPPFHTFEGKTGINWRFANQGINLATQAYTESHSLPYRDEASAFFTRQLYMHGLTYLLRGLPSDLTAEEILSIQAAMPANLIMTQTETCDHAIVPFIQDPPFVKEPPPQPSLLHRITAIIVVQAFIIAEILLPYIKLFISRAYEFEKKHKLTKKFVSNGLITADALRRRTLQLSHTICQMNDGKVGQALNDLAIWWVTGLTGGLQQGITEGVIMITSEKKRSDKAN